MNWREWTPLLVETIKSGGPGTIESVETIYASSITLVFTLSTSSSMQSESKSPKYKTTKA